MKKIMYFACAAAMMLTACNGGKGSDNGAEADSTAVEQTMSENIEEADLVDAAALADELKEAKSPEQVQGVLTKAQAKYQQLVESGKLEEAKQYMKSVQQYIANNAETIKTAIGNNATVSQLVDAVKALPTGEGVTAEAAIAAAKAAASGKAADVIEAVKNSAVAGNVQDAAAKATEAIDQAKDVKAKVDAASEKVEAAKAKIDDAKAKVENVKSKVEDAKTAAAAKGKEAARSAASEAAQKGINKLLGN